MFWDGYIAIVYGVLCLRFVAYPIAFQQERGWSPGIGGLSFVGIGVGVLITIACEPLFRKVISLHRKNPETGMVPPEAMVSIVFFGATLLVIGQLWFAWTCTPNVHWTVSILAGVPFGMSNACVFIYASNYIARSYDIYVASALAGNMFTRSVMGAFLPLAGPSMYKALGLNWASNILGVVEAVCILIPVVYHSKVESLHQTNGKIADGSLRNSLAEMLRVFLLIVQTDIHDKSFYSVKLNPIYLIAGGLEATFEEDVS
jgi:hypothetical protein